MVCSFARWPADDGPFETRVPAQAEVQRRLVLRGEAASSGHPWHLLVAAPEQGDLGADRAAVTGGSFQFEFDPFVFGSHRVLVHQQGPILVGHDNVQHSAIPQVRQGDGASVIGVRDSDRRGHIDKSAGAVIEPDAL